MSSERWSHRKDKVVNGFEMQRVRLRSAQRLPRVRRLRRRLLHLDCRWEAARRLLISTLDAVVINDPGLDYATA
jgi:hypothetical protein